MCTQNRLKVGNCFSLTDMNKLELSDGKALRVVLQE
jgi:hypothetical protein